MALFRFELGQRFELFLKVHLPEHVVHIVRFDLFEEVLCLGGRRDLRTREVVDAGRRGRRQGGRRHLRRCRERPIAVGAGRRKRSAAAATTAAPVAVGAHLASLQRGPSQLGRRRRQDELFVLRALVKVLVGLVGRGGGGRLLLVTGGGGGWFSRHAGRARVGRDGQIAATPAGTTRRFRRFLLNAHQLRLLLLRLLRLVALCGGG